MTQQPLYFVWTVPAWQDYLAGRQFELPWLTVCDYTARQEYSCGLIISVLRRGKHFPIKPVTIN